MPEEAPKEGLVKLHSTHFTAEGDGPKTSDVTDGRHWYGKKRRVSEGQDGVAEEKPVPTVKHRKLKMLKKLFNVRDKLKPLGLGGDDQGGAKYDGQAPARDQEEEEPPGPTSHEAQQDDQEESKGDAGLNEKPRDLFVQVIGAQGLRGLDSNGLSDPYCRLRLGKVKDRTKTISKTLQPHWNETFVFPAAQLESSQTEGKCPRLDFELWDSDFLAKDEFLGQAHLELSKDMLRNSATEPVWLSLYGEKRGGRVEGLGELKVAVWLSPSGQLGRLNQAPERAETKLTTLCSPPGVGKQLPLVVHTEGNCLYEEPCMYFLRLFIGQVRDLEQFFVSASRKSDASPSGGNDRAEAKSADLKRMRLSNGEVDGAGDPIDDVTVRPVNSRDEAGVGAWAGGGNEDESSSGSDSESEFEDEGQDPFDEEESFENPLQVPSSESNSAPPSASPMRDKRLYFEVAFGSQRRRTKISRLKDRAFKWDQGLVFAATLPMKDRPFKLLLCEVDRQNQKSRLLAIAFIRISKLFAMRQSGNGHWFKLHDYTKRYQSKPLSFGAVRLQLTGADADERRDLYGLPLMEPQKGSQNKAAHADADTFFDASPERAASSASSMSSQDTQPPSAFGMQPRTDSATSTASSSLGGTSGGGLEQRFGSSIAMYLGDKRTQMRASVISAEDAKGFSKFLWQALALLLLLLQFCLALLARFFWSQNTLLKRSNRTWRRMMKRWSRRPKADPKGSQADASPNPKPGSKPLGLVKLLLSSVEMQDQPAATYFCVLKCGPHWGQTEHIKNTTNPHWGWEVHLPIYDPDTLVVLCVFRIQPKNWRKTSPPQHIGKLRIRLNTLVAGQQYEAALRMLSDRKSGAKHTATAHLHTKVIYFDEMAVVKRYFKAPMPREIYEHGFEQGDAAKQLDFDHRRLTKRWLESTSPAIPKLVAKSVLSNERQQFEFSRAKVNWTRFMFEKESFTWIVRFWKRNQRWENPAESLALMGGLVAFSFRPQIVLSLLLLALTAYALLSAPKRPSKPAEMRADPIDEDENDEVAEKGGIVQLRRKYERLVRVALAVQNYLEDMANTLERLHDCISWADPHATTIFLFACVAIVLAITAFSLPLVLSVGLCWTIRVSMVLSSNDVVPLEFNGPTTLLEEPHSSGSPILLFATAHKI